MSWMTVKVVTTRNGLRAPWASASPGAISVVNIAAAATSRCLRGIIVNSLKASFHLVGGRPYQFRRGRATARQRAIAN